MKVIGVTGRSGSGKNEVCRVLLEQGVKVLDVDAVGHDLLASDTHLKQAVARSFPESFVAAENRIDRKTLGSIVFSNSAKLGILNALVHPRLALRVHELVEDERRIDTATLVLNAALLYELGLQGLCDQVWAVLSPDDTLLARLQRRGLARERALGQLAAQRSEADYRHQAQVLIENNASLEVLRAQVLQAWRAVPDQV